MCLIISHPFVACLWWCPADDPTSPSIDLQACYVPARSVVSSSQASTMATLTSTSVSPTLSSISPFVRLRSQDCSESQSPTLNTERLYKGLEQYTICSPVCLNWNCQTSLPMFLNYNDLQCLYFGKLIYLSSLSLRHILKEYSDINKWRIPFTFLGGKNLNLEFIIL